VKQTLHRTGQIRVHTGRDGDHVVADVTPPPFHGAFTVRLAGRMKARVGLGTVENIVPLVNDTQVTLDGRDAVGDPAAVPTLDLVIGPGPDLRSWICLQVTVDDAGVLDPKNRESAIVGHVNDLTGRYANGVSLDQDGRGYLPLAMLVWRDKKTVQRIVQNVYFNQRHSFKPPVRDVAPGAQKGIGIHIFQPAA